MADTAAALATDISSKAADLQRLKELTNWDDANANTINSTRLADACDEAINRFKIQIGSYDPVNYPLHKRWIRKFVYLVLFEEAGKFEDAENLERVVSRWVTQFTSRKRVAPDSNSSVSPTSPSAFDDANLDGYH